MRLRCEFSTPVARIDTDDYIRHLVVSIECFGEDDEWYVVGKLAMDQILWSDALADGVSLFEICDNDSQGLHEAHVILTNGHDSFRPSLGIRELTNHVIFLYGAVFHPSIHRFRQDILDSAFNLFGKESLGLMWLETSGLPTSDLAELGFRKIAGKQLVFRHSAWHTPFSGRPRQDVDVEGLPEHQEWVMKAWDRFTGVAGA